MNPTESQGLRIAIVGAGFAGSILARVLQRQGHQVTLLERSVHPRFALGESSTPLAALSLERLAARWDLPDLHHLAAYARWTEHLPNLRRGLKRGFTFVDHTDQGRSPNRLLVAASPADRCADAHWMRSDLDHFLLERAASEGVRVLEGIELERPEGPNTSSSWEWRGLLNGSKCRGRADFIVDGSGAAGWLAGVVAPNKPDPSDLSTFLLAAHFSGVEPLQEQPADPYPAGWAAVHHLIDCGWIYELRFSDGLTSAGVVVDRSRLEAPPRLGELPKTDEGLLRWWKSVIDAYPALRERFSGAQRESRWMRSPRLQRQATTAAGRNWTLLPSSFAFWSPLFSTGHAWSLLGVERLAEVLSPSSCDSLDERLDRYDRLLAAESNHLRRLTQSAYSTLPNFEAFHGVALVYFAAASYFEVRQRLQTQLPDSEPWCWSPFLGASDPTICCALQAIEGWIQDPSEEPESWVTVLRQQLAPRDIVGLDAPQGPGLYPADLAILLSRLDRLDLTETERTSARTRLRC